MSKYTTKLGFKTKTKTGKYIFRINIDNDVFLNNLEQGNTHMAIDICTDKYGKPYVMSGKGKHGMYSAIHFYTWSMPAKGGPSNATSETKQNPWVASS